MNRVLLGAALLLLVPLASAQRLSHDGVFALRGLSFSEGCMMAYRTTNPVNAHAQPSATSPVIRTVDANRRIDLNDFNDGLTSTSHTAVRRVTRTMALRKVAQPEDVARQVVVLASDRLSGHVTGQVVTVAGGMEGRVVHENE